MVFWEPEVLEWITDTQGPQPPEGKHRAGYSLQEFRSLGDPKGGLVEDNEMYSHMPVKRRLTGKR